MIADWLDEAELIYRNAVSVLRRSHGTAAPALPDAAGRGIQPRPLARKLKDQLLALLASEMPADTLQQLFDEGRRLSDSAACAIAFPPSATQDTGQDRVDVQRSTPPESRHAAADRARETRRAP